MPYTPAQAQQVYAAACLVTIYMTERQMKGRVCGKGVASRFVTCFARQRKFLNAVLTENAERRPASRAQLCGREVHSMAGESQQPHRNCLSVLSCLSCPCP